MRCGFYVWPFLPSSCKRPNQPNTPVLNSGPTAEEAKEKLAADKREFDNRKENILSKAEEEADKRRQELMGEARQEADGQARAWQDELARRREDLADEITKTAAHGALEICRGAVGRLAGGELNLASVESFLEQLEDMEQEQVRGMNQALKDGGRLEVRSARELADKDKERIAGMLRRRLETDREVDFQADQDLVLGLELVLGGMKLGWNLNEYLESLSAELDQLWQSELGSRPGRGGESGAGGERHDAELSGD